MRAARGARRLVAFALQALAQQLARAADRLGLLAGPLLRRLLVAAPQLHLAEETFALHLLLEGAQRLIDVVVAYLNLHGSRSPSMPLPDAGVQKTSHPIRRPSTEQWMAAGNVTNVGRDGITALSDPQPGTRTFLKAAAMPDTR